MFGDLIEFVCVSVDHLPPRVPTGREVTTFDRCWAYCGGGADGGHEWQRVEAAELATTALSQSDGRAADGG